MNIINYIPKTTRKGMYIYTRVFISGRFTTLWRKNYSITIYSELFP